MAGYSGTPLPKKLGIKEGARLALVSAPDGFLESTLAPLPDQVELRSRARGPLDVIVFFTKSRAELERRFDKLASALNPPARCGSRGRRARPASHRPDRERRCARSALPKGLVDTKVCAIDDTWSGLSS